MREREREAVFRNFRKVAGDDFRASFLENSSRFPTPSLSLSFAFRRMFLSRPHYSLSVASENVDFAVAGKVSKGKGEKSRGGKFVMVVVGGGFWLRITSQPAGGISLPLLMPLLLLFPPHRPDLVEVLGWMISICPSSSFSLLCIASPFGNLPLLLLVLSFFLHLLSFSLLPLPSS